MSIEWLSLRGLRNLAPVELLPTPGLNWLQGPNGAGKTSVLEGIFLLARGRSFRTANISGLIQHGAEAVSVVARRRDGCRLGIERQVRQWRGRIDGRDCQKVSEFAARLPLVLVEPDSHRLVDGAPRQRRQYLDWLLFHVEHGYLLAWQRFARVLRQRNAALKAGGDDAVLDALEPEFLSTAAELNRLRRRQADAVAGEVETLVQTLGFALPGRLDFRYRPGHPADSSLERIVAKRRNRDRERGFSQHGPHRADLVIHCDGHPAATELSRGQQKLLAMSMQLAGLRLLAEKADWPPMLLLDDPVSELDARHLARLLDWLEQAELQSWVTATAGGRDTATMFHVEQGRIRPVV
ncbi:DNA replication/repair protein RecF [Wenzhouxiangella sp. AB-CW3]|uniref:DNA replication/repair protein RecF n=1 Tax=Wenzhouxiangella sp. AB-CW3 TaxID=2771012 RepID=UPI00168BA1E9|nr:DNA replication/repair protein RecF [Wenzhouxiangella sp. AB-CW3]QOC22605.1 DNA replication/repair protein RecF [Wenzhouxiangella sp. AB-CW3]